jgi:hypothetical protein
MKKEILNSYLFKAADRFYPNADEISSVDKFPKLNDKQVKEIEQEMASFLKIIQNLHSKEYDHINNIFAGQVRPKASATIRITSRNVPICQVASDNKTIELDVKIAQALFRGALLDYIDNTDHFFRDDFLKVSDIKKDDPDREQKIIKTLMKKKAEIEQASTHTIVGDMADMVSSDRFDESSWSKLAGVSLSSMSLMNRYQGSALFMIAHEYGHIVLHHRERLRKAREERPKEEHTDMSECQLRVRMELEADAYAVVLLTKLAGPIRMEIGGIDKITGYENFFRYVYHLGGFPEEEDRQHGCSYPDLNERLRQAESIEEAIWQKNEDAMWEAINKQFDEQLKKMH